MRLRSWTIKKNWVQQFFYSFFLSKIDTYKIKNQQNIKVTRKKNQTKTNYVTQLIMNQILSDEIKKKQEKNTIVMDKNEKEKRKKSKKGLVSRARKA